jgi:hypothetical protein
MAPDFQYTVSEDTAKTCKIETFVIGLNIRIGAISSIKNITNKLNQ